MCQHVYTFESESDAAYVCDKEKEDERGEREKDIDAVLSACVKMLGSFMTLLKSHLAPT